MSVWLPTAPCTPDHCATAQWPTAGRLRAVARLVTGTAALLAGVLLSPLAIPAGRAGRARLARLWSRAVLRAFGVRIRITGPLPFGAGPRPGAGSVRGAGQNGTLVVANHISWLDIPLVAAALPGRMLAKHEIRQWPLLGPLAARGGTLFVERDRLRALPALVRTMSEVLRRGRRVVVFPEGSTWCGRGQGRFRNAAFQAALDAGAAVQPVHISYRPTGAAAFVGDDPLGASLWRVVTARALTAELTVLPLVPAGAHSDRRSLARAAQRAVDRAFVTGEGAGENTPCPVPAPGASASHAAVPGRYAAVPASHAAVPAPHAAVPGRYAAVRARTGLRARTRRPEPRT